MLRPSAFERIPEERLRRRIPGSDRVLEVDRGDSGRAVLEEGLEVLLLPLELGNVVVDPVSPDELALKEDGRHEDVDVDE